MLFNKILIHLNLMILTTIILSACSYGLELREDLPESAFACMQQYAPEGDPFLRKTGERSQESSFLTIDAVKPALEWRLALIDSAQASLDIQYFLWKTDETGSLLVRRVLAAANRGVAVRILMDDFDSPNWNKLAATLTMHPKIEIRVFNPFKKKRGNWAGRGFELVTDLERLNHRMHNKLLVADKRRAIVGGRNLANEYFGAGKALDYRDYDVIALGPVVAELSHSFEVFWDSVWSYRISDLPAGESDLDKVAQLKARLDRVVLESDWLSREFDIEPRDWAERIAAAKSELTTAPARAVFDCPPPQGDQFPVQTVHVLKQIVAQTSDEILMISPYMVPLEGFHQAIAKTVDRGVTVRLLTNSLAAADHTIAFSGYKKHRLRMLENGLNIHELRPDGAMWQQHRLAASTAKHIALHAKIIVLDKRWVYVGSLNLDPRAVHWNTELGVLADSPQLAAQIYRDFSVDLSPENSWQVKLRVMAGKKAGSRAKPEIIWVAGDEEISREPSKGIMQRISLWFFSMLPIDELL